MLRKIQSETRMVQSPKEGYDFFLQRKKKSILPMVVVIITPSKHDSQTRYR
jgi:hypothetical protein